MIALALLAGAPAADARAKRTVGTELSRLLRVGAIDGATSAISRTAYRDALRTGRRLSGARRAELLGAVRVVDGIAARGALSPSRLGPLTLTLERNREWWGRRELLAEGARVSFPGSELVWQKVPGQGIQFHPLASFGKLNGFFLGGRRYDARAALMLDELLGMASERAGAVAWEYYFAFGGGSPPWVSALAQGTALQALTRVATRLGRQADVFPIAARAVGIFELPTPTGVNVATPEGSHYALYSFAPDLRVLNGFVQSLVGLFDYAELTGDARARALFDAGDAAARVDVPRHDTGAWSLYATGSVTRESDLAYHVLLRDFLTNLCKRTAEPVYCTTEASFTTYLREPPLLFLRTARVRARSATPIGFDLSKIARVGMTVSDVAGRRLYTHSALTLPRGSHTLWWPVPRRPGVYVVRLGAIDLAGNSGVIEGQVEVLPARRRARPR